MPLKVRLQIRLQVSGSSNESLDTLSCVRNKKEFCGLMYGWNAVTLMPGSVLLGDPGNVDYRL